jgi:hypothetical protein
VTDNRVIGSGAAVQSQDDVQEGFYLTLAKALAKATELSPDARRDIYEHEWAVLMMKLSPVQPPDDWRMRTRRVFNAARERLEGELRSNPGWAATSEPIVVGAPVQRVDDSVPISPALSLRATADSAQDEPSSKISVVRKFINDVSGGIISNCERALIKSKKNIDLFGEVINSFLPFKLKRDNFEFSGHIFNDTLSFTTAELGLISTTCLITFETLAYRHLEKIIEYIGKENTLIIHTTMLVSLAMCINYSVAIPSMMCEIIITNNWPTIEILHFSGASDAFIRRELRLFAQRHLISALIKAVIVDFILYSSINYAASMYGNNIASDLLEGGGRVLISGAFLFVTMTFVLFVKLFFRISIR